MTFYNIFELFTHIEIIYIKKILNLRLILFSDEYKHLLIIIYKNISLLSLTYFYMIQCAVAKMYFSWPGVPLLVPLLRFPITKEKL